MFIFDTIYSFEHAELKAGDETTEELEDSKPSSNVRWSEDVRFNENPDRGQEPKIPRLSEEQKQAMRKEEEEAEILMAMKQVQEEDAQSQGDTKQSGSPKRQRSEEGGTESEQREPAKRRNSFYIHKSKSGGGLLANVDIDNQYDDGYYTDEMKLAGYLRGYIKGYDKGQETKNAILNRKYGRYI